MECNSQYSWLGRLWLKWTESAVLQGFSLRLGMANGAVFRDSRHGPDIGDHLSRVVRHTCTMVNGVDIWAHLLLQASYRGYDFSNHNRLKAW